MIVVARGRGILVLVIAVACLLLSDYLTGVHFGDSNYYAQHGWPKLLAFLVAAAVVWLMVFHHDDETLGVDPIRAKKSSIFHDGDSLFYIPVKYWPGLLSLLGLIFYFMRY
ncbi:MAG: hypothetical protein ABR906_01410 [Terracidiphilus sp.]|jgi:hypothetical protein